MAYSRASGTRSIAVACALFAFALAASLGMAAATPGHAYAGSKTSVYVVSKVVIKYPADNVSTTTYSYKNGLVKAEKRTSKSEYGTSLFETKFAYTSKNVLKSSSEALDGSVTDTVSYKVNAKGQVVKSTTTGMRNTTKYTYDKKGQLVKYVDDYGTTTCTYFSNGNLKSKIYKGKDSGKTKDVYTYDKRGNYTKATLLTNSSKFVTTYKSTYKHGRLVKQVVKYPSPSGLQSRTAIYKYKKVSVPKSIASYVKAQQRRLILGDLPVETAHK